MRLLGYNKRQQRLLGLFPDDRLAFNHNKPSAPAYWLLSGGDALHWQARSLLVHQLQSDMHMHMHMHMLHAHAHVHAHAHAHVTCSRLPHVHVHVHAHVTCS